MTSAPKRVVVWGTGFVGKLVIAEIVPHPAFELVGVGVSNPDKVGRDAGEICGLDPVGITATDDVDALIALRPDALVHYGPTAAYPDDNIRVHRRLPARRHRRVLDRDDALGVAGHGAEPARTGSTPSSRRAKRAARRASPPASTPGSPTTCSP